MPLMIPLPTPLPLPSGRELLKEAANDRGWAWKNAEGAKERSLDGLAEWYRGLKAAHGVASASELMAALVRADAPTVDAMSARFGTAFDECVIALLAGLVIWDSHMVDADGIRSLEEPAIFAFSFGTGDKIGPALSMPTKASNHRAFCHSPHAPAGSCSGSAHDTSLLCFVQVGPGCETPGKTNEGLAAEVAAILSVRPMPVYAQWEIADALLHGADGHPRPESFFRWEFGDDVEDGDPSLKGQAYARVEMYTVPGSGATVPVHKSLPIWPLAIRKKLVDEASLADGPTMKKFYLSTVGVLQQNAEFWAEGGVATKPKSVLIVGQLDHGKRCRKLVKDLVLPAKDGGSHKEPLGLNNTEMPTYRSFSPPNWGLYACDQFGYDHAPRPRPQATPPGHTSRPCVDSLSLSHTHTHYVCVSVCDGVCNGV